MLLPSLLALGCARSGEVVIVLDSTTGADSVEVVAFPGDDRFATAVGKSRSEADAGPEAERLRALADSTSVLSSRFQAIRDSLNREVEALGTVDRTTRAYAVRFSDIQRRTQAAESIRLRRDSVRARAAALEASAGTAAVNPNASADAIGVSARTGEHPVGVQRHTARDSTLRLSLAPGRWSIGVARRGEMPTTPITVTVSQGSSDTLRLTVGSGSRGETR